jgi:hypothetical protein
MELNPSGEAGSCAATQEIPNILWSPKDRYYVHKIPEPGEFNLYHLILFV